jgi:hypothetical protein
VAIGVVRRCRAVVEDHVRPGGLDLLRLNIAVPDERRKFGQASKTRPERFLAAGLGECGHPIIFSGAGV